MNDSSVPSFTGITKVSGIARISEITKASGITKATGVTKASGITRAEAIEAIRTAARQATSATGVTRAGLRLKHTLTLDIGTHVRSVDFSPDARWMAVSGAQSSLTRATDGWWNTVTVYDVAGWKRRGAVQRPSSGDAGRHVPAVGFSPDGGLLALVSWDRTIRLLNVPNSSSATEGVADDDWTEAAHFTTDAELRSLTFSPDGTVLAVGLWRLGDTDWDANIRLYGVAGLAKGASGGGIVRAPRELRGHRASVTALAFSPDGGTLASASMDGTVRLWDRGEGFALLATLAHHTGPVLSVAFSPSGELLVTGGSDGAVDLIPMDGKKVCPEGRRRLTLPKGRWHRARVAPDGSKVIIAGEGSMLYTFPLSPGAVPKDLKSAPSYHAGAVNTLMFTPGGMALATGGTDGTVHLHPYPLE